MGDATVTPTVTVYTAGTNLVPQIVEILKQYLDDLQVQREGNGHPEGMLSTNQVHAVCSIYRCVYDEKVATAKALSPLARYSKEQLERMRLQRARRELVLKSPKKAAPTNGNGNGHHNGNGKATNGNGHH